MIVNTEVPNIERSQDFKETKFGIRSQADLVHIFSVLRNKMYSDKVLAVLREYSTNAFDAHVLAGKRATPIVVDLPTALTLTLHIRDFGTGLSEEEIREVYCMYGASTKRQSNDFNGQLGFGSKAAFSYTDSYTITSFQGGKKIVYEAFIDESNLGAVSKLMEAETAEPDGIKISVPVKKQDIQTFESKARDLYQYFEVHPEFPGRPDFIPQSTYEFSGNGWRIQKNNTNHSYGKDSVCIMGNVAYPLNVELAFGDLSWEDKNLFGKNTVLIFNIGELSIAASREALEYDKLTKDSIRSKLKELKAGVRKSVEDTFKDIKSILDFKKKYRENRGTITAFEIKLKFNGVPVEDDHISLPNSDTKNGGAAYTKRLVERAKTNIGIRISTKSVGSYVGSDSAFINADVDDKVDRRLATLFEKQTCGKAYMFSFATQSDKDAFLKYTCLAETEMIKLSDFAPKDLPKGTSKNAIAVNSLLYTYVPQGRSGIPYGGSPKSIFWDAMATMPNDPLFVALDRFYLMKSVTSEKESNLLEPIELRRLLESFKSCTGISVEDRVVGIKIKPFKEMTKKPTLLVDFMIAELSKKLDNLKPSTTKDDVYDAVREASGHREMQEFLMLDFEVKNDLDKAFLQTMQNFCKNTKQSTTVNVEIRNIETLLGKLGADVETLQNSTAKRKLELVSEINGFLNRHPLLRYVDLGYDAKSTSKALSQDVQSYLNR